MQHQPQLGIPDPNGPVIGSGNGVSHIGGASDSSHPLSVLQDNSRLALGI